MRPSLALALISAALLGTSSAAADGLPEGFVRLSDVAPAVRQDLRYAGPANFTGAPLPGYAAAECWLLEGAAGALARASDLAQASGWRLVVYDCYRPVRAVAAFVAWSQSPDQSTKADYYPALDKRRLFALGYIARTSGHSTGRAIDLGAERLDGAPLDFGTQFDRFDPASSTDSPAVSQAAQANRHRLVELLRRAGLVNYPREWWHFSYAGPGPTVARDAVITAR